jgi:hypothetical protein
MSAQPIDRTHVCGCRVINGETWDTFKIAAEVRLHEACHAWGLCACSCHACLQAPLLADFFVTAASAATTAVDARAQCWYFVVQDVGQNTWEVWKLKTGGGW